MVDFIQSFWWNLNKHISNTPCITNNFWRHKVPHTSLDRIQAMNEGTEGQAHSGKRVFLGMLDDSVTRYGWVGLTSNAETLNRTLIEGALLGVRSCARIGNILYHPDYLNALLGNVDSSIIPMMRSGFFQIQMLKPSINETIAERLRLETNSTEAFVERHNWSVGSDMYRELDEIDKCLEYGIAKVAYNGDFKPFFRIMMQDVCDTLPLEESDTRKIFEKWRADFSTGNPEDLSRSNFEETAKDLLEKDSVKDIREAMWLANTANHYAYGAGMACDNPNGHTLVRTTPYQDLASVCTAETTLDSEVVKEGLTLFERDKVVSDLAKNLRIPDDIQSNPARWERLAELVNEDNPESAAKNFLNAKDGLLNKISRIFNDPSTAAKKELLDATKYYSEKLYDGLKVERSATEIAGEKLLVLYSDLKTRSADELLSMAAEKITPYGSEIKQGIEMGFNLLPSKRKDRINNFFYNSVFHAPVSPLTDLIDEGNYEAKRLSFGSVTASQTISQAAVAELSKKIK